MLSDAHFMTIAHVISDAGTCTRLQVGAVLVYARRIISTGYNGTPAGRPHCFHNTSQTSPCLTAVHAEANVIAYAAKHGIKTSMTTLYTTDSPCHECAKLLINAGVKEVKYEREYRATTGLLLLEEAGVAVTRIDRSNMRVMSYPSGDRESVPTSEPAWEEAEGLWERRSGDDRRGSAGIQRGTDGEAVFRSGREVTE